MPTTPIPGADRRHVPRWVFAAAGGAPLLLVGGWTIAAGRQPAGYNSIRDTISSLAAQGARDRWVMTAALFGLGASYAATGLGFRSAAPGGRMLLTVGGLATMMVAAFPQPMRGNSIAHSIAAAIAFTALAAWPVGALRRVPDSPLLSARVGLPAVAVMFALLIWFVLELHGSHRGLAERAAALSEAVWPLAVLIGARDAPWRRAPLQPATCSAGAA